jgi:two-component system, LuxR family, response regulator FixJ
MPSLTMDLAMNRQPTVFLVDPDGPTRDAIANLAGLMNLHCEAFVSGEEFFAAFDPARPCCVVMEIKVPGMNGLQIQKRLRESGIAMPIIFISSGPSVSIAVHAMRAGALHFLEKPVRENDLWNAIQEALQLDEQRRKARLLRKDADQRAGMLTEKEQAVLEMIADGLAKQAIAGELGVSVRTVEHHRTQLMRKLQTNSMAGLMQFALARKHGNPLSGSGGEASNTRLSSFNH